MTTEQLLIKHWRNLPAEQQQAVLEFALSFNNTHAHTSESDPKQPQTSIQNRLRDLRQTIVESGIPLLNEAELEAEIASRRGGINP